MSCVKCFSGGIHVNVHEDLDDELNRRNHKPSSSSVQRPRLRKDNISAGAVKNVNQSHTDPKQTTQKVLWTNSRDTSVSVGSQESTQAKDSAQTIDTSWTKQLNQHSTSPDSFPQTSSGTSSRGKTGSPDLPQVYSIFPKPVKKETLILSKSLRSDILVSSVSRADDLKSSVSSSISGSSRRSQVSQNSKSSVISQKSRCKTPSHSEDDGGDEVVDREETLKNRKLMPNHSKHSSVNDDIVNNEENAEVDENSELLPVGGASINNLDIQVGNLTNDTAQSPDPYSFECDRKLSSSNSSDGEEVPLVSVKEPVEPDDLNCGDADRRNATGKELQCSPYIAHGNWTSRPLTNSAPNQLGP